MRNPARSKSFSILSRARSNGSWSIGCGFTESPGASWLREVIAGIYKGIKADDVLVLSAAEDSYDVASRVHDLTVKIRPDDTQKIALIRDMIAQHVDTNKILEAL